MKTDGGPAFPKPRDPYPNCDGVTHPSAANGMSLRDWFAGQALAGGIVSDTMKEYQLAAAFGSHRTGITREEIIVANAYRLADAMLARSPQDTRPPSNSEAK